MRRIIKALGRKLFPAPRVSAVDTPVFQGKLLEGKRALIIGGSGGIGSEIARSYVANGCRVVVTGTNVQKLEQLCCELGENQAHYVVANLKDVEAITRIIREAASQLGQIDILVHCAGLHCRERFGIVSEQTWDDVMGVNLKSMYFACQEVGNYMIQNQIKGHILTVSSASSAKPGWTPYEISKNGVKALTLGFADKLIPHGIVVNSLAPGPVSTSMLGRDNTSDVTWPGNPTGRMCTPAEIANWATFLVSGMGDMVVGDTFYVTGGSGTICLDK